MPKQESIHWTSELAIVTVIVFIALCLHFYAKSITGKRKSLRREREIAKIEEINRMQKERKKDR